MKWRNITQTFIFVSIFLFRFSHPTWSLTILTSFFRLSSLKQNFPSLTHPQAVSSHDHSCQQRELELYMSVWIGNPNLLPDPPLAACISGLPFEGAWLCRCCRADVGSRLAVGRPAAIWQRLMWHRARANEPCCETGSSAPAPRGANAATQLLWHRGERGLTSPSTCQTEANGLKMPMWVFPSSLQLFEPTVPNSSLGDEVLSPFAVRKW